MFRIFDIFACLVIGVSISAADVVEWTGTRTPGTDYVVTDGINVEIRANGVFKFHSEDVNGNLDVIGSITIADSVTGTVTLYIERDTDNDSPGATNCGLLNLTNQNATPVIGNLAELRITGSFGGSGNSTVAGITGVVDIDTDLVGNLTATTVSGNITVDHELLGSLTASSFANINIRPTGSGVGIVHTGNITIGGDYAGTIDINAGGYVGTILIQGDLTGVVECVNLSGTSSPLRTGKVEVTGDLDGGRIAFSGLVQYDAASSEAAMILIGGSIIGSRATPLIEVGTLTNTVGVNGCLTDANSAGPEIYIHTMNAGIRHAGAVTIDYDGGDADSSACWTTGAQIRAGNDFYDMDDANGGTVNVWFIGDCKGDFNGDGAVSSADSTPYNLWKSTPTGTDSYEELYAGLEGSAAFHGDGDFSGTCCSTTDNNRVSNLINQGCCLTSQTSFRGLADCDNDFDTDLSDLTILLSNFGTQSGATEDQGDFDPAGGDGDVDISDLSLLLSNFGTIWNPCTGLPSPLTGSVTISVDGYETGYSGGGFEGEKYHFVFDAIVTINTGADDWTGSGVTVTAANSAAFLLVPDAENPPVPGSSIPDKYATFFSVPYSVNASSRFTTPFPTGGLVGRYTGSGGYAYSTSVINAAWYDMNSTSNDGPAAVFRVVIDVSGVSGADTSGGFGSVYFTTGTPGSGDIKVADMTFEVEHKYDDSGATTVSGSFYVTD